MYRATAASPKGPLPQSKGAQFFWQAPCWSFSQKELPAKSKLAALGAAPQSALCFQREALMARAS